jgi:hypothetical protein
MENRKQITAVVLCLFVAIGSSHAASRTASTAPVLDPAAAPNPAIAPTQHTQNAATQGASTRQASSEGESDHSQKVRTILIIGGVVVAIAALVLLISLNSSSSGNSRY